MPSTKQNEERLQRILSAWRALAPTKWFAGMTLEQFEAKVKPSFDARRLVEQIENQLAQAIIQRDEADDVTLRAMQLAVTAVIADPTEGQDSALYEAMGYTRLSERKTGLTRKKKTPTKA
jgi:hypothetical protein